MKKPRTARIGHYKQDSRRKTVGTGPSGQGTNSQDRTNRTEHLEKGNRLRTTLAGQP